MRTDRASRGFTLIEIAVLVVIGAFVAALLAVAQDSARRSGQVGRSLANLRQLSIAHASYQVDFADRIGTFSWQPGDQDQTPFPDLKFDLQFGSPLAASSAQFVHLIRIYGGQPGFPRISNFIPHPGFSQIPLLAYLGEELISDLTLAPGDASLRGFRLGTLDTPDHGSASGRWVFRSSYEMPPSFYAPEGTPLSRMKQRGHNGYDVPQSQEFRGRNAALISFPSEKVMLFEQWQFYFGPRVTYWAMKESRIPLVLADGSAAVRTTADANEGWKPNQPTQSNPTLFRYAPNTDWEPPAVPPGSPGSGIPPQLNNIVVGHYRWTRAGIFGRDYGPEVPGF